MYVRWGECMRRKQIPLSTSDHHLPPSQSCDRRIGPCRIESTIPKSRAEQNRLARTRMLGGVAGVPGQPIHPLQLIGFYLEIPQARGECLPAGRFGVTISGSLQLSPTDDRANVYRYIELRTRWFQR